MLIRPALREYRIWTTDSRRWAPYRPRPDDIIISAFPKSGQTWTQQIVSSLIFQDAAVRSLLQVSPWIDGRFGPLERTYEQIEAQTHRRFLKAHLPIDGLPVYDDVKYIHVARDGRDVVMSMHNHYRSLSEARRERLSKIGAEDPVVGRPFPPIPQRPDEFFRLWLTTPAIAGQADGLLGPSYFDFEAGFWVERHRPNFLFVHYQDLLDDREGEMRRIARFLNIEPDERVWSSLVDAAGFSAMRAAGDQLMPEFSAGNPFFNKGTNGRWQGVFAQEDLALYEMKVKEKFSPDLDAWLSSGRLATGESKSDGRRPAWPGTGVERAGRARGPVGRSRGGRRSTARHRERCRVIGDEEYFYSIRVRARAREGLIMSLIYKVLFASLSALARV